MENFGYQKALKQVGISYLGKVGQSAKMEKSVMHKTNTYCLYLAQWTLSGHNTCPNGQHCHGNCLGGSGRNIGDSISHGNEMSTIYKSRIKKTKLFYENRQLFMDLMVSEIIREKKRAEKLGVDFSVRINGTSDLSPVIFKDSVSGKNILELFPEIQFYDYSKRPASINEMKKYHNYDVTFSYDGYNWAECEKCLESGGKVAVVFYGNKLPKTFNGYVVESGNEDDIRYKNSPRSIIGLHYHKTINDYTLDNTSGKRKYKVPTSPFIIMDGDSRCEW